MNIINRKSVTIVISFIILALTGVISTFAATTPPLWAAASYGILSKTYTNTIPGTTINGDIGFTTGPAVVPGWVHTNFGSSAPYASAGVSQGSTLSALALQPCTHTFPAGAVDLATDTSHGTIGIYTPWVYCTTATSAATIGTAWITLNGAGTYIFRIDGALNTVANSKVTLSGASACNVFWTPTGATTLGANSTFVGTNIDDAGITMGINVQWIGRALAFGETVTTSAGVNMTALICQAAPATLHVIKEVVNTWGGTAVPSDFILRVKNASSWVDLSVSGNSGTGTAISLTGGTYVVSEAANASYSQSFSGDCSLTGSITLSENQDKICILTNTFVPPVVSGSGTLSLDSCPNGDYSSSYYDGICGTAPTSTGTTALVNSWSVIVAPVIQTGATIKPIVVYEVRPTPVPVSRVIPKLPATGIGSEKSDISGNTIVLVGLLILVSVIVIRMRKNIV